MKKKLYEIVLGIGWSCVGLAILTEIYELVTGNMRPDIVWGSLVIGLVFNFIGYLNLK